MHIPALPIPHLSLRREPDPTALRGWKLMLGAVGGAAVIAGVATALGTRDFRQRYESEKAELLRYGLVAAPRSVDLERLGTLPEPVRRYVTHTRASERTPWRIAELQQQGALRTGADGKWVVFDSEQLYSLEPPGFVWYADARVFPGVRLLALDKSIDGHASMNVAVMGAVPVVDARGPRVDLGAALRLWGELLAFPELVTDPHLRWEPIDDTHARVHVDQPPLAVSAVVDFNGQGLPIALHADRYRSVGGTEVLTPWTGHLSQWRELGGRLFPTEWRSVWHLREGDFEAVKLTVSSVRTW